MTSKEQLEAENKFLRSLLQSFWTGDVPENASLDHLVLAKAGRLRLQELSKKPVLLTGNIIGSSS
jgi:hypothetical protein